MHLKLSVVDNALHFESTHYFLEVKGRHLRIPQLLCPGKTTVIQKAIDENRFSFSLEVVHGLLGKTYWQYGVFQESDEQVRDSLDSIR
jgi:hypothetical protein